MTVSRRWLEEFVSLRGIEDERLYEIFNSIGLEVESMERYDIPGGVVVGRVLSCEKHPDADKLNLCRVDVGEEEPLQIVCGAANVRNAEYVAVATVGTVLSEDFEIRPAKLRGVESFGMICSSTELGLPPMEEGIMILDESIGELVPGRPLNEYEAIRDTRIELELTANRGDCLSVMGVARDLGAALEREVERIEYRLSHPMQKGIARELSLHSHGDVEADIAYIMALCSDSATDLLTRFRLAQCGEYSEDAVEAVCRYTMQATGVLLRAYDAEALKNDEGRIELHLERDENGAVRVLCKGESISVVGAWQDTSLKATAESDKILFELSYIEPQSVVDAVSSADMETDPLYYRSSRGSEPDIEKGLLYMEAFGERSCKCSFSADPLTYRQNREERKVAIDLEELNSVIGESISRSRIHSILKHLGFELHNGSTSGRFVATIPPWRHDIVNIQDVAEEVLRIVGIDSIEARPLQITEKNRLSEEAHRYIVRRDFRQRAAAAGFYEAVTYAFCRKSTLRDYGFETVEEGLELLNPIVEELDTLRSTILLNLLDAARRNISYGKRRIALFELGSVFDRGRSESEKLTLLWCGDKEEPSVANHGKPESVDFPFFVRKLGAIVGDFELRTCEARNALMHPWQSAEIVKEGRVCGYLSKLHLQAAQDYGLPDTYIAELDFDALIPGVKQAEAVSNYQGVYKDLSVLVERELPYGKVADILDDMVEPLLKRFFPIDIYEDEKLGERKSLTLRLFLQSDEATLSDADIERVMGRVLELLESGCGAKLR